MAVTGSFNDNAYHYFEKNWIYLIVVHTIMPEDLLDESWLKNKTTPE